MNRTECEQLVESYVSWLRKGLSVEDLKNACELTTPFLDRHNDHLQIYAVKRKGKILLSDDGYILSDLRTSGLDWKKANRKAVLESMLNGFGVRIEGVQLIVEASQRNLGQRIHSLVQAMLSINDMFMLAQPRVASFFWEDVKAFLEQNDIRFSPRVKISGRSGFDNAIDFLIPKSRTRPERFIQTINSPNKNNIESYLFVSGDTRDGRGNGAEAYALLNNDEKEVGGDIIEALEAYHVCPAYWSDREDFIEVLSG